MNRPVISATIAAGVLFAGPGLMVAATAVADRDGSASGGDADAVATDDVGTTARPPRVPFRGPGHPVPDFPYIWPVVPSGPSGNSGFGMIPRPPAPQTPVSVISGGVDRVLPEFAVPPEFSVPEVPPVSVPAVAVPAVPLPQVPVFSVRPPAALPAPQGPLQPVAVTPMWTPPAAAAPAPVPAAPRSPAAVPAAKPAAPGAGVPELASPSPFGNADLGGVAARALPGLAALLGVTAIGAVLGYRQAKAGHMLRAAGAARFLQ